MNPKVYERIQRILTTYTVACTRTLEQKISDAGPNNQRVDPVYLTQARSELELEGIVEATQRAKVHWYYLAETPKILLEKRLTELIPIHAAFNKGRLPYRIGQTLEIAVYKSLCRQDSYKLFGGFTDLDSHDDSTEYKKVEPPLLVSGKRIQGALDFILAIDTVRCIGVEVKNTRPWIYPQDKIVKELLQKCCTLDLVP